MYTVAIVDDEPLIIQGLQKLIDWNSLSLEFAAGYVSPSLALDALLKNPVDILITDLKMPNITGLDLLRELRLHQISTKCIILSGYAEFSLIQQAVPFGIEGYLLKPVDTDELHTALRNTVQKISGANKKNTLTAAEAHPLVHRVLDYMNDHFSENLSLKYLASMFHASSGYLGKLFHQQTGKQFNEALSEIRIEHAKQLLVSSSLSVQEIAVKTGWRDINYFYVCFRKSTGCTPSEWRMQNTIQ